MANPLYRLLEKTSPATQQEELSRPQFLYDQALAEPESALDLVEKEQLRLVRHLPELLDAVRDEVRSGAIVRPEILHAGWVEVSRETESFMAELVDQNDSRETLDRVLRQQGRHQLIVALEEVLFELAGVAEEARRTPDLRSFVSRLVEGLHAVLLSLVDTMENPEAGSCEFQVKITADRGDMVESVRRSFPRSEPGLPHLDQQRLFELTGLFERSIWLIRRHARWVGAGGAGTGRDQ